MKISASVMAACIGLLGVAALGNGGTFDTSDVGATGNLVPRRQNKIILDKELLHVRFAGDQAQVDVTYTLRNTGGADSVTYGFPIDAPGFVPFAMESPTGPGTYFGNGAPSGITGYEIDDGRGKLGVDKVIQKPGAGGTEQTYGPPQARDWFMTRLLFSKGETKKLHVSYTVELLGTRGGTSKNLLWDYSPVTFVYTFKPAQTWGDGRVAQLDIVADLSAVRNAAKDIRVGLPGGDSTADGDVVSWHFKNYDLAKAPDLKVTYDDSLEQTNRDLAPRLLPRKYIESIRVSSVYPPSKKGFTYGADNLLDGKPDTAWIPAAPGNGTGEWIEIRFKGKVQVNGVGLLNGYCKSEESLKENGQVSRMEVEALALDFGDPSSGLLKSRVKLARTQFADAMKFPYAASQLVCDFGDGFDVKRVRLKITGVSPGTKYAQAAISELFIYGNPAQSP